MRDIVVTMLFLVGAGYTIKKPHFGILMWSWFGYMNPHKLTYGFAYNAPFSQLIAILTISVYFFSDERKKLPEDKIIFLLVIFIAWMGLTTVFAFYETIATQQYIKVLKIQIPIFLTLLLFNNKQRINQLLWVIFISIGYFAIKGGVFTIITGGSFRVWGPPSSFIEENNSLAVATLMVIPIAVYLRSLVFNKLQKQLLLVSILLMCVSVIGSQSRGAFLAINAVGGYYWLQSQNKISIALLFWVVITFLFYFLPETWFERMYTIKTYDEDASALGRIEAWNVAYNVANARIFGGGFNLWSAETFMKYLSSFQPGMKAVVAHSIYFGVLGEHGWVGLFLFLLIYFICWRYCNSITRLCYEVKDLKWAYNLSKMIKISFLAYLTGGAFLSLSYFDLPWHLVAITVLLKEAVNKQLAGESTNNSILNTPQQKKIKTNSQGYLE